MLAIFRRPATEADDAGVKRINDRQPGEDPARSRLVRSRDATIFLWPMRDGVCQSVGPRRVSGCTPLDLLRRRGVAIGTESSRGRTAVYGVVVDGIREVLVTASGEGNRRVAVTDNFFFAQLGAGVRSAHLSWRYAGRRRSFDLSPALGVLVPPAPTRVPERAPDPRLKPRPESVSSPLEFTVAGTRYRAVGFQTPRAAVCTALTDLDLGRLDGASCLAGRPLRDALENRPAHLFSAGGGGPKGMVHTGFARGDVVEIAPVERAGDVTVVLSEPWRPAPWRGEPIRFFLVFDLGAGVPEPGRPPRVALEARLRDGRTVPVP
jgi:hypothetical protein